MLDLSIIIVSYNTKDFLKKCLESIVRFTSKEISYEIIVVDNNSSDGSAELISNLISQSRLNRDQISNLRLIRNNMNLGFSTANNIGVKEARGRYLLFLNSDTEIIQKHTLEEMVAFMDQHDDAGAATCYVELPDKTLDDAAHRGFPTPWNAFCHFSGLGKLFSKSNVFNGYHLGWKNLDKVHEIDALAGSFMISRREAGEKAGWWDEDYFFYGEDLDFCYKLKEQGWKIYFVPTVKVLHYKGISSGIKGHTENLSGADKERKIMITNSRFNVMKIFYRKHYQHIYPRLLTAFVLIGINLKKHITLLKYH